MRAYHNSREQVYRNPFGAICKDGTVCLSMDLFEEEGAKVQLKTWIDGKDEEFYPMEANYLEDRVRYSYKLKCQEQALVWYSFIILRQDGTCMYYGAKEGKTGGEGEMTFCAPPSFQITVYKERIVPDWYKNAVVYQIFPDRFNRGKDFEERKTFIEKKNLNGPGHYLVNDWNRTPEYDKNPDGTIKNWDFYGGTLQGIIEKLDYLENMGITVLYINPIFKASSNHRYDTADYTKIDEVLGTEDDFKELCKEAEKRGISIILDGVFNHTGCDSKYFNRYNNYTNKGAWQGPESEYYDWFRFKENGKYDCWWGVEDLPNVEENSKTYQDFIYGSKESIVRKWLKLGAKGWRLDVADELPDFFIAGIKKAVVEELGDEGLLMGEVWEDASNKISYSKLRKYFLGDELDCVMNYVFRDMVENFVLGKVNAYDLAESMMSLYENYPKENFYSNLNLLGSHDRMRVLSLLGNAPSEDSFNNEHEKKNYKLNDGQKELAMGRLWISVLIQMLMPGVPSIYYGDEAGLEGYADPYNRAAFPWDDIDRNIQTIHRNAISLRKIYSVFIDGDFKAKAFTEDVYGFYREKDGFKALVLINRSIQNAYDIKIKEDGVANDVVTGADYVKDSDGYINVHMSQLGSSVIMFRTDSALFAQMERGAGVLCHITSIPGGTLGKPARKFVDYLVDAGQKYWQILPINPTDMYGSPYAGQSAFAGNISLTGYSMYDFKKMYKKLSKRDKAFKAYKEENAKWLDGYAMYCAVKEMNDEKAAQEWEEKYRKYSPRMYKDKKLAKKAEFYKFTQFKFEEMWQDLRKYAMEKGIKIIGDMPMYVAADSADAWSEPEMFTIGEDGYPSSEAGVPPDPFSEEGQLWGNPLYDWKKMEKDGYEWWMKRIERALILYDYTRLDHFRGFEAYWKVPKGEKALKGEWILGPGCKMFEKAYGIFGALPFIAEDLGTLSPGVRALLEKTGFPGTDVIQFYDKDVMDYIPDNGKIAYTGTHDNQTLRGWIADRYFGGVDNADNKEALLEKVETLKEKVYGSRANVVIIPLQDVLELDDNSRMNKPGTTDLNWKWQVLPEQMEGSAEKLKAITEKYNR